MDQPANRARLPVLALILFALAPTLADAQVTGNDQLSKILTDPDKLEELKKEKLLPPIEFFISRVLPHDTLPYIKANHWTMVGLEMRANHDDYQGMLQSRAVGLAGQPNEVFYRRDARLIKGTKARLNLPILLPTIPKEMTFQLVRPDSIRQDEEWPASLKVLEPHQQLVVVLTKNPNDPYNRWSSLRASMPSVRRSDDAVVLEKLRYYRFVLPQDVDKPLLSSHPLTWSPISHVIWDGLAPETLGVGQQQAMLDWLHWGGQLIIVGGPGPVYAPLRESFLAPYLPAEVTGESISRSGGELNALSTNYLPPSPAVDPDDPIASNITPKEAFVAMGRRYKPAVPIKTTAKKPIYFAGLNPKPGASSIPIDAEGGPPLAVEWKVGRGRVVMLSFAVTDPDLVAWPGYDTMIRRVALRRPEERVLEELRASPNGAGFLPPRYESLPGPDLTTVRYLSRDLGAPTRQAVDEEGNSIASQGYTVNATNSLGESPVEVPVGEWLDTAELPSLSREKLEKASGIEIPNKWFVLKVILAYVIILVPLNWLICRYLLGRKEWAWVVVPTLSLAFAIGVERAAAYDVGYDSSCDEIDLVETHGGYPRGHISRFASIYSTGRVRYSISYPKDPTALALPLATGRSLRGEDATQSSFQTLPSPALTGFQVQPRSLALFRAEQMADLPGTITLGPADPGPRMVTNNSGMDLKDAWVIELAPKDAKFRGTYLGEIADGLAMPLGDLGVVEPKGKIGTAQFDPGAFHDLLLRGSFASKPEEVGELRLVAWAEKPLDGQVIEPVVDRHRGFTMVVAHLRPAPLLDPASPRYNAQPVDANKTPAEPKVGFFPSDGGGTPMAVSFSGEIPMRFLLSPTNPFVGDTPTPKPDPNSVPKPPEAIRP